MTRHSFLLAPPVALVALTLVVAAGCDRGGDNGSQQTTTPAAPATTSLPSARTQFAAYATIPLLRRDTPPYAGPATPHSLDGVLIVDSVRPALGKPGVSEALTKQGFAVVPSDLRFFHNAYEGNVYDGWPVFVTTDVAYHEWHQVFDKILRDVEQKVLLPKLQTLVRGLMLAANVQAGETNGSRVENTASRVEQLFQVAAAELGLPVTLGPLAEKEKALVDAHDATEASPITGAKIDYSLFTPRGHYTRNAALTRYFKAMSVLGQSAFCLPGTTDCPGLEPARIGILASRALVEDPDLVGLWRDLYEPTAFLVGLADDYTPLEVAAAAQKAAPNGLEDAAAFANDATVEDVLGRLAASRPVRINPERASIRLMGTRFVIDSFILDQLLAPNVTGRLTPSALDLAAAFGSGFAYGVLKQEGETGYPNYDTQLAAMRKLIATRPAQAWGSTVYDAWLHALEPMFVSPGKAFPDFMRSQAWTAKDHQTAFGSYTELKHDSILYAKQSFAEGGDSLPVPPARRNWVEPDPVAFARLAAVADLMRRGLGERNLLTPAQAKLVQDLIAIDHFLERIARDELAGKPISKQDNSRLTHLGGELEALWWRTADLASNTHAFPANNAQDALVADISSSPKGVLEVATGRIDQIYVVVPDDEGTFQVAVGGVYSYYEFTTPPGERLTDEAWRARLDAGQAPERPAWEEAFLAH
jgi:hypothetical protein